MRERDIKLSDDGDKKRVDFPYWVLLVSVLITLALTYNFYQNAVNKDSLRFNNEVGRVQSQIENKINLYIALLKGGRGFIESSTDLSRESFSNYVGNLELEKNYAGVQGIGYSEIAASPQPQTGAGLLLPVVRFYEPESETNRRAVGFDLSAEAARRGALETARDTGSATASGKVKLVEESVGEDSAKTGFLIFLPVYKNGETPASVEERRKNLRGYIYSSFRANDFLSEIQKDALAYDVSIRIFDADGSKENLMAQTILTDGAEKAAGFFENGYLSNKNLDVAGRRWTLEYGALPAFTERSSVGWTWLIFLSGGVFSLFLFAVAFWEVSARATLQKTADELFALQRQKQILLEKEQKARLAAEQANRAKDDFIAVVSHELRTPLNAIAGWASILKTEDLAAATKNLALEKIEKNLRSQAKLVEELLDYSQIISSAGDVSEGKINFSELFENVFAEYEFAAREKHIELTKSNNLNGQKISGDREKIKLLIENLFSNAVKFTDAGGKISTFLEEEAGSVRFTIRDNGEGISREFLPHIFERFSQSDYGTTRNFGGLGLGLAITNQIVKAHRGTIEAASDGKGKGAAFTVKFPIDAGD